MSCAGRRRTVAQRLRDAAIGGEPAGQPDLERRAFARRGGDTNRSAEHGQHLAADGEPETAAAGPARARLVQPIEAVEDPLELAGGNTRPRIAHGDDAPYRPSTRPARLVGEPRDDDAAAVPVVEHGVGEDVVEALGPAASDRRTRPGPAGRAPRCGYRARPPRRPAGPRSAAAAAAPALHAIRGPRALLRVDEQHQVFAERRQRRQALAARPPACRDTPRRCADASARRRSLPPSR